MDPDRTRVLVEVLLHCHLKPANVLDSSAVALTVGSVCADVVAVEAGHRSHTRRLAKSSGA